MASTMMAASRQAPEDRLKVSRIKGTSTIMPTRPYTTEGIPASSSTADLMIRVSPDGATFARKMAVISPTGTPITTAPAVP